MGIELSLFELIERQDYSDKKNFFLSIILYFEKNNIFIYLQELRIAHFFNC